MITKFCFKQAKWVLKNVEFDANSLKKVAKKTQGNQWKRQKNGLFYFCISV